MTFLLYVASHSDQQEMLPHVVGSRAQRVVFLPDFTATCPLVRSQHVCRDCTAQCFRGICMRVHARQTPLYSKMGLYSPLRPQ